MAVAALISPRCVEHLTRVLRSEKLLICHRWEELESALESGVEVALFDPSAPKVSSSRLNAELLLRKYPSVTFVAYVEPSAQNLREVFQLSKVGLRYAFAHPVRPTDGQFKALLEKSPAATLSFAILEGISARMAALPSPFRDLVFDVFEHPHRYCTAKDLALQANVRVQNLYERFGRAGVRTPKQLLVFAKIVHAYCAMRVARQSPRQVAKGMGFRNTGTLSRHVESVIGCTLRELREGLPRDEILVRFIEWIHKPAAFTHSTRGSSDAATTGLQSTTHHH